MKWIKVQDQLPKEEQAVFYYFDRIGVYAGHYTHIVEDWGEGECFYSDKGWLMDDVTHWMSRDEDDHDIPDAPFKEE